MAEVGGVAEAAAAHAALLGGREVVVVVLPACDMCRGGRHTRLTTSRFRYGMAKRQRSCCSGLHTCSCVVRRRSLHCRDHRNLLVARVKTQDLRSSHRWRRSSPAVGQPRTRRRTGQRSHSFCSGQAPGSKPKRSPFGTSFPCRMGKERSRPAVAPRARSPRTRPHEPGQARHIASEDRRTSWRQNRVNVSRSKHTTPAAGGLPSGGGSEPVAGVA